MLRLKDIVTSLGGEYCDAWVCIVRFFLAETIGDAVE